MREIFKKSLTENLVTDCSVIAAVSGGADSLCLLLLLREVSSELNLKITVAHFNHNLQVHSHTDQEYVHSLCDSWNLKCFSQTWAEPKASEEAARRSRYEFLARVAQKQNSPFVLTGHTQSDLAETLLFNLVRGAGLSGMTSLKEVSPLPYCPKLSLLRPLLAFDSTQTREYCSKHHLIPRLDVSNENLLYNRNLLRHQVMPLLNQINTQAEKTLAQSVRILNQENDFLDQIATQAAEGIREITPEHITIDKEGLLVLNPVLARRVLRQTLKLFWGHLLDLKQQHIEQMLQMTRSPNGKRLHLPHNTLMTVEYHQIVIGYLKSASPPQSVSIGWEEEVIYGNYVFKLSMPPQHKIPKYGLLVNLHPTERLEIGAWQKGQKMRIEIGHKKVSDILGEAKIAQNKRLWIPVVTQKGQPIWLVGVRQSYYPLADTHAAMLTANKINMDCQA